MLVELSVMEQRYQAVLAVVQDGWKVTEVADRLGVSRQTVHTWIARYQTGGLACLADRSHRPDACPHQISPGIEAEICELRRQHPGWGPRRICHQLQRIGVDPVPSRSAVYRCLKRHGLIELRRRRKRRDEFRRWERERPMQLWQMDVMGGVELEDGTELKIVTGIDDHSRFCVAAGLVRRAISKAVCTVLSESLRRYGIPDEILTDNGKVFTGRFGPQPVGISAVVAAVGVLDGHGAGQDEEALRDLCPDPDEREKVLQVAARIMDTSEFAKVQKALRLKLQHTDRLRQGQIARVAATAVGVPVDVLVASCT